MKIAVTGASGFIGKHVLNCLQKENADIVAISRMASNLSDYKGRVQIVEADIYDDSVDFFSVIGQPDVLIHLAWDGLQNYKSLGHFEVELPRQYHFLKRMVNSGLKSVLVTGTCFEYGMQRGCLTEDMPGNPTNPYGFAKDALRKQLTFLQNSIPFNLTWARLFYLYGEGQATSSLFTQLRNAVSNADTVFNMSGGEQLRDFQSVEQVADSLVRLALLEGNNGIVNVSSGHPTAIKNLVENWLEQYGWDIQLNLGFYPYPDYEPMEFWGDNTFMKNLLRKI